MDCNGFACCHSSMLYVLYLGGETVKVQKKNENSWFEMFGMLTLH